MLVFFQRAFERVDVARQDADTSLFLHLMYFGEFVLKLATLGMVAGIQDDRDRHRYRQLYKLVRADGVGEWGTTIDEIVTGTRRPASARRGQNRAAGAYRKMRTRILAVRLRSSC